MGSSLSLVCSAADCCLFSHALLQPVLQRGSELALFELLGKLTAGSQGLQQLGNLVVSLHAQHHTVVL